ncbi:MAG: F0F1 ATP synthase subunit B [Patescibacteria group bacterium]
MSQEVQLIQETATQAVHATEASGGLGTLGINLKIFIAQLVNFLIVLIVLWKWAYKPIVKMLEQRTEKIEKGMKSAELSEKKLSELEVEKDKIIAMAKSEAQKIHELARAQAEERKQDMVNKAKSEVESVIVQGKAQLKSEKDAMLKEARKDIIEIAVAAVEKILVDQVDEKKSKSFAEEVVKKMTK